LLSLSKPPINYVASFDRLRMQAQVAGAMYACIFRLSSSKQPLSYVASFDKLRMQSPSFDRLRMQVQVGGSELLKFGG